MKQLYVAWTEFQRRQVSMQQYFSYSNYFLGNSRKGKFRKLFDYLEKSLTTFLLCLRHKPGVVWLQLPPTPVLTVVLLYKILFNRNLKIVADCHNAMFRAPWAKLPLTAWQLNRCNLVLVHNDSLIDSAMALGVKTEVRVLEDAPASMKTLAPQNRGGRPKILFPASFAADEPIAEFFAAAKKVPQADFYITGNPARARGSHDLSNIPDNVTLTGFLSLDEFERLFMESAVILALTKFEGIQLSVCNEAVGAGKPMVVSNTEILRRLFYKGALHVDWRDPAEMAKACEDAISRQEQLGREARDLCVERIDYWKKTQADGILDCLGIR